VVFFHGGGGVHTVAWREQSNTYTCGARVIPDVQQTCPGSAGHLGLGHGPTSITRTGSPVSLLRVCHSSWGNPGKSFSLDSAGAGLGAAATGSGALTGAAFFSGTLTSSKPAKPPSAAQLTTRRPAHRAIALLRLHRVYALLPSAVGAQVECERLPAFRRCGPT